MDTTTFIKMIQSILVDILGTNILRPILESIDSIQARPSKLDKGKISYMRGDNRVHLTTRRFLTRILKLSTFAILNVDELAIAIDKRTNNTEVHFRLLKGSDIVETYRVEVGGHSCMTADSAYKTKLYAMNPDRIRLVTVQVGNESARCLLWYADDKKLYFDRIYSDSIRCCDLLWKKLHDDWNIQSVYLDEEISIRVSNLKWNIRNCPYMDSLGWGTINKRQLLDLNTERGDFTTQVVNGYYVEKDRYIGICIHCATRIELDEIFHVIREGNMLCDDCRNQHYTVCSDCEMLIYNFHMRTVGPIRYCCACYDRRNRAKIEQLASCNNLSPIHLDIERYSAMMNQQRIERTRVMYHGPMIDEYIF